MCPDQPFSALTDIVTQVRLYFTVQSVGDVRVRRKVGHRGKICGKNEAKGPTVNKK